MTGSGTNDPKAPLSLGDGFAGLALPVARTVEALRRHTAAWRRDGQSIALVPTMGALHAGHRSLITEAQTRADRVIVSIFVNPKQFGPEEDFSVYPRREFEDLSILSDCGVDLGWLPSVDVVYPPGFQTAVRAGALGQPMEGMARPGFFDGVATVVAKLFTQVGPDIAVFGEKDYQQLLVVSRMARDLDLPVEVVAAPTVREADGLALSSRNAYLSDAERTRAAILPETLFRMAKRLSDGVSDPQAEIAWGRSRLAEAGFDPIDYLEVRDPATLEPVAMATRPARILVAAWLGKTRLIDNVAVG